MLANLVAAAAPSNNLLLNPAAIKTLEDTGGLSALRGIRALLADLAEPPRVPAMVEPGAFEVGRDLAVTPGSVVFRTEMLELIQYAPTTGQVHEYPVLIVPPMINKYYITDLAPGRSMTEYLVSQGHQVFAVSWRNPDARHRDWDLDSYGAAVVQALDATIAISGAAKASICALCSGGIVSSMVASYLSSTGLSWIAWPASSLASPCSTRKRASTAGAMIDEATAAAAVAASSARGYLDGRALAESLRLAAARRPHLELLGQQLLSRSRPPAVRHPVLERRHDPAARCAAPRLHPGSRSPTPSPSRVQATMRFGSPVDLEKVDTETCVIAGHRRSPCARGSRAIAPPQLLGGPVTFVLSTSGHIASMVNPPGNPKGDVPDRGGRQPGRSARLARECADRQRQLVAALFRLARRPQRRGPQEPRQGPAARASRYSPQRLVRMFTTGSLRTVAVGDQLLRTSVRPGRTAGRGPRAAVPLLLINGIGASLELLEPFVDKLDPAIEVIRFDVPGVGGSPLPARPYRFTGLCGLIGAMLTQLGYDTVDVLGISWGGGVRGSTSPRSRRDRAAVGSCSSAPRPAR